MIGKISKQQFANLGNRQVSGATAPWMKLAFSLTDTTFMIDINSQIESA